MGTGLSVDQGGLESVGDIRGQHAKAPRQFGVDVVQGAGLSLLLGGALVATSFGWNPFGNLFGGETETPSKDKAPTKDGIPVDGLPGKKDK